MIDMNIFNKEHLDSSFLELLFKTFSDEEVGNCTSVKDLCKLIENKLVIKKIQLYSSMDNMRIFAQLPVEYIRGIGSNDFMNVNFAVKNALKKSPYLFESADGKYSTEEVIEILLEDVEDKIETEIRLAKMNSERKPY